MRVSKQQPHAKNTQLSLQLRLGSFAPRMFVNRTLSSTSYPQLAAAIQSAAPPSLPGVSRFFFGVSNNKKKERKQRLQLAWRTLTYLSLPKCLFPSGLPLGSEEAKGKERGDPLLAGESAASPPTPRRRCSFALCFYRRAQTPKVARASPAKLFKSETPSSSTF